MGSRRTTTALCGAGLVLLLSGCGGLFDDLLIDCIDFDGPEFATDSLPRAIVGQSYSTLVTVDIVREPNDDSYDYRFSVEGQLPPGLQVRQNISPRRLEIYGQPSTAGSFNFRLKVTVADPNRPGDGVPSLCWYRAEKSYTITVAP
jgi:hypothetical protein